MSLYTLALFVHVGGVVCLFGGMGTWLFGLIALRRARRVEQVRVLATMLIASGYLLLGSLVPLGAGGFYMALTVWGVHATWIIVATVGFLLLAPLGALVMDPRVRAIAREAAAAPDGELPVTLAPRTRDPILGTALCFYIAVLFGIIFLMTTKPPLINAMAAIAIAATLGLLSSVPLWWAAQSRRVSTGTRHI